MYCYFCMNESSEQNGCCIRCGRTFAKDEDRNHMLPGTMLKDKYMVGNVLGQGGFGITYAGRDTTLDIRIAIKEYYPTGHASRDCLSTNDVTLLSGPNESYFANGKERFLSEAKALAKFNRSGNIVHARDFFELNNTAYIIMDFVEGQDLRHFLRENGRIEPQSLVDWFMPILNVLGKVHAEGLIHRDISPDNIIVENGDLILIDFGAARDVGATKSLSVMLKPGYAPGEQYTSDRSQQGPWTDIYAVCATMYECITGITPQESSSRLFEDKLQPPSALGIAIPPHIEAALMHGMANRYKDRPQNVPQLIAELRGLVSPAYPAAAPQPDPKTVLMNDPRTVLMDRPAETVITGVEVGHLTTGVPPQTGELTRPIPEDSELQQYPQTMQPQVSPDVLQQMIQQMQPPVQEQPPQQPEVQPAALPPVQEQPQIQQSEMTEADRSGKKKFVIAIAAVCALVLLGGVGVTAALSRNNGDEDASSITAEESSESSDTEETEPEESVTTAPDEQNGVLTGRPETGIMTTSGKPGKKTSQTTTATTMKDGGDTTSGKKTVTTKKKDEHNRQSDDDDNEPQYEPQYEPDEPDRQDDHDSSAHTDKPQSSKTTKATTKTITKTTKDASKTTTKSSVKTTAKATTVTTTTKATTTTTTSAPPVFDTAPYDDGVAIMVWNRRESDLVIPERINGAPVRAIADGAFQGNSWLERVTLPDTLKIIGKSAFSNCHISELRLCNDYDYSELETICENAFNGNEDLKKVMLPPSLKWLDEYAFAYCDDLEKIYISSSELTIGTKCFIGSLGYDIYYTGNDGDWDLLDIERSAFEPNQPDGSHSVITDYPLWEFPN